MNNQTQWYVKPVVFVLCLLPFAYLLFGVLTSADFLGANPVEYLAHRTGDWGLRFMLIVLMVSPLRRLTGWSGLLKFRRMLGLFAFFYVTLHLVVYVGLDLGFNWPDLGEDILERPYITVGFTAWLLLIPLALTSTRKMMRVLGRHWKKLHQLVYLIAFAGVVHYVWLVKKDLSEPLIYVGIFVVLMLLRLPARLTKQPQVN